MKKHIILCLLTLACSLAAAQRSDPHGMPATFEISLEEPLQIIFSADQTIENLLVIVTDSLGQTLFLENKYRFRGFYHRDVSLQLAGRGHYYLLITMDEDKMKRDVIVK